MNGMAIEIVKSRMVFVGKCLKVCNSFSVNVLAIGIGQCFVCTISDE